MNSLELLKPWPIVAAIAGCVLTVVVLIQGVMNIAKCRYELRKLKAEMPKPERQRPLERAEMIRSIRRSRIVARDTLTLTRWVVLTVFLFLTSLSYVYVTMNLVRNGTAIREKREQLEMLKEANSAIKDSLTLIHRLHDQRQKR